MQVSGIRVSTNNQISPVSAFDKLLFCFKINRRFSHLCLKYIIMTSLKCSLTSTCNIAHVLLNFSQVSLHPGWNIWAASFSVLLQFAQPVLSANKDEEICLSVGRQGRWRISQTRTQSAGCSSHAHKDSEKQQHAEKTLHSVKPSQHDNTPSRPPADRAKQCLQTFRSRWWSPAPARSCSCWTPETRRSYWIETVKQLGLSLGTNLRKKERRRNMVWLGDILPYLTPSPTVTDECFPRWNQLNTFKDKQCSLRLLFTSVALHCHRVERRGAAEISAD